MKLVPIPQEAVRLGEPLPFDLRDSSGRLLLTAGSMPDKVLGEEGLPCVELFAREGDCQDWVRRVGQAMQAKLLRNAALREIVAARPDAHVSRKVARECTVPEHWTELALELDAVERDIGPDTAWLQRLLSLRSRVVDLFDRKPDASLYWLVYHAGHSTELYSSHHALLCALISRATAQRLDWPTDLVGSLELAALTMNVSIRRLQNQLAVSDLPLSASARTEVEAHAERSAQMLTDAGIADPTLIGIVRHHHVDGLQDEPLDRLAPAQRAARLLRRVDIFAAKLSVRRSRPATSPVLAARDACLGRAGVPDEVGAALVKTVGLYPPGCFVELEGGEIGIVIGRGLHLSQPVVAALISASGTLFGAPALRNTRDRRFAVKGPVPAAAIKVVPPHELLTTMR